MSCSLRPNISSGAFIFNSLQASEVVAHVRSSPPVRRVGSRVNNVSSTYASRKMGYTIQFESYKVELWAVYTEAFEPLAVLDSAKTKKQKLCRFVKDLYIDLTEVKVLYFIVDLWKYLWKSREKHKAELYESSLMRLIP